MEMKSMLLMTGAGWVLGYISRRVVAWWKKEKDTIAPEIAHIMKVIESKLNINIPDGLEEFFVNVATQAVNAANQYVSDPLFIRNVIRAVMNKDMSKFELLKTTLLSIDWKANVMAQLPEDIKAIVNVEKENLAVEMVRSNMAKVMPLEKIPSEDKLREVIKVTVQANKIEKEVVPVTEDLLKKLIAESEARQAAMTAK
jgi:hypothetical protein